jgi:hypothetical protein
MLGCFSCARFPPWWCRHGILGIQVIIPPPKLLLLSRLLTAVLYGRNLQAVKQQTHWYTPSYRAPISFFLLPAHNYLYTPFPRLSA